MRCGAPGEATEMPNQWAVAQTQHCGASDPPDFYFFPHCPLVTCLTQEAANQTGSSDVKCSQIVL